MDRYQVQCMRGALEKLAVTEDWIRSRLKGSGEATPQGAVRLRRAAVRASPADLAVPQGLVGKAAPEGSALSKRRALVRAANQRALSIEGQVYSGPGGPMSAGASVDSKAPTRVLGGLSAADGQSGVRAAASDDMALRATRAVGTKDTLRARVASKPAGRQLQRGMRGAARSMRGLGKAGLLAGALGAGALGGAALASGRRQPLAA